MITDSQGDPLTRRELLRLIGRLEQVAETSRLAGPGRLEESPEPRDEEARTSLDAWDRFAPRPRSAKKGSSTTIPP